MTNLQKLIAKTAFNCINNNISFCLIHKPNVEVGEIKCSGYFDEKDLKVATKKSEKDWVPILVHESCHLDQFLEKSPLWKAGDYGINTIDSWLTGKHFEQKQLIKAFCNTIKLEVDCEIKTVKKIKQYKLNIPIRDYIQKVNAYIFSYWATYRDRKWYPFPYNNPKIYKKMPTEFLALKQYLDYQTDYLKVYRI
jgi:hypothetical protein